MKKIAAVFFILLAEPVWNLGKLFADNAKRQTGRGSGRAFRWQSADLDRRSHFLRLNPARVENDSSRTLPAVDCPRRDFPFICEILIGPDSARIDHAGRRRACAFVA